jgi:hypothetical protein
MDGMVEHQPMDFRYFDAGGADMHVKLAIR